MAVWRLPPFPTPAATNLTSTCSPISASTFASPSKAFSPAATSPDFPRCIQTFLTMASPFVAEITLFAGNFAPIHWAFCNGQLMSISQNTALFSLLGTTYGGDGKTTFALPDLQGRLPMHFGQGPGLSNRDLG